MHTLSLTAAGLLGFAASAQAVSSYFIKNQCPHNVSLTWATKNETGTYWTQPYNLTSGTAYTQNIVGQDNSLGITRLPSDYWSSAGPKMILGTTTKDGELYWDLSSQVAEAFTNAGENFNCTSASNGKDDVCGSAQNYTTGTHACNDDNVALTVHLCSINS